MEIIISVDKDLFLRFLADVLNGRAHAAVLHLSVCRLSSTVTNVLWVNGTS